MRLNTGNAGLNKSQLAQLKPTTISEVFEQIGRMGTYRTVPAYAHRADAPFLVKKVVAPAEPVEDEPDFFGLPIVVPEEDHVKSDYVLVVNDKFQSIVGAASSTYVPVQPEQVFDPMVKTLESAGWRDVLALVDERPGKQLVVIVNPEYTFTPGDGHKILMGVVLKNSGDQGWSAFGGGYGLRQICQNQFSAANSFGHFYAKHVGDPERIAKEMEAFVQGFERKTLNLLAKIEFARTKFMSTDMLFRLLKSQKYSDTAITDIIALFSREEQTYYGAFNALTAHAKQSRTLMSRQEWLNKAEPFVAAPNEILIPELVVPEAAA